MTDEKAELERERVRLWYVAATRARELMVVPRLDVDAASSSWRTLGNLGLETLPAFALPEEVAALGATDDELQNPQTQEVFLREEALISSLKKEITWAAPSRGEDLSEPLLEAEEPSVVVAELDGESHDGGLAASTVQGGRERGLILHKLLEEVLSGETSDVVDALAARAIELAGMLGVEIGNDQSTGLSSIELALTAQRALAAEPVAALRSRLVPEFNVFSSENVDGKEEVRVGIADAIAFSDDGIPDVVIDWKSDVAPSPDAVAHYKAQVRAYLAMTGTPKGLIVFATSGAVHPVTLTAA